MLRRLVLFLLLAPGFQSAAAAERADSPVYAGQPRYEWGGTDAVQVLLNPGFVIGYSDALRQPLWVTYQARSVADRDLPPRPQEFQPDARVPRPVLPADYRDPRYDRGHLAPNYLIGKLYGRAGQLATFLMSNITPQTRRLNQLLWQRLEEVEADRVAPAAGRLWVVVGPVPGRNPQRLKSGIPVPAAFYRIWLDAPDSGPPRALAFVVPQDVCGTEPLSSFVVNVDEVERNTGLDFFHRLDDGVEHALEAAVEPGSWRLHDFDRLPPRYLDHFPGGCPSAAR